MTNLYRATVGTLYTCDYSNESQSIESSHTDQFMRNTWGIYWYNNQKKKKRKKESKKGNGGEKGKFFLREKC